jgi:hypothetical protein
LLDLLTLNPNTRAQCRHLLPEAMAWHRNAMDKLHAQCAAPPIPRPSPRNRKHRTLHLAYTSIARYERGITLATATAEWHTLSAADRQPYVQYVAGPGEVREAAVVPPAATTRTFADRAQAASLAGMGSDSYPMSAR